MFYTQMIQQIVKAAFLDSQFAEDEEDRRILSREVAETVRIIVEEEGKVFSEDLFEISVHTQENRQLIAVNGEYLELHYMAIQALGVFE